ncbi:hypothetical protein [[Eubacterium] hominis]
MDNRMILRYGKVHPIWDEVRWYRVIKRPFMKGRFFMNKDAGSKK